MKGRGKGNEWLLLKKKDEEAVPGWDVEDHAHSVLTGRTQEEIAQNLPARKEKRKSAGDTNRVWVSDRAAKKPARTALTKFGRTPPKAAVKKKPRATSKVSKAP
jgi:hypothetical protein